PVIPLFSVNTLGPVNTITFNNGSYSFRLLDYTRQPHSNMELAVLKTAAPPVSISRSGQTPAVPSASQPVVVNIALSHSKSSQEHLYVRWSQASFSPSHHH